MLLFNIKPSMLLFNIKIRGDYHLSHCTETITVCNMIISIHNDGNDDVDDDDDVDNDDGDDDDADDADKIYKFIFHERNHKNRNSFH